MCEYTKITRRVKFDITILLSKKQLPHPLISTTGSKRYLANPLSVVTRTNHIIVVAKFLVVTSA